MQVTYDCVIVDRREGTIIMDLRPKHDFVKVRWADALSDGELVAVSSVRLTGRKCSDDDFGKGDTVIVDGRKGTLIMDLRPEHHEFVKVQWLDDGADSDVLPVHSVALVSKASPAAAASENSSCPGASSGTAACSAMDTDPSSTPPARRHGPSMLDGTSIRLLPEDATGPRCFLPRTMRRRCTFLRLCR